MPAAKYPPELREAVHADALIMGIRPAARKHSVNEDTARVWAHREGWILPQCLVTLRQNGAKHSHNALEPDRTRVRTLNGLAESIDEQGEHSRAYLSSATLQASHQLASSAGRTEGERVPYSGLLNTARAGDVTHGWQAQRQQPPPPVQVAVIMPTPEETAQRLATDRALDAIAARLRALPPAQTPGGGGRSDASGKMEETVVEQ